MGEDSAASYCRAQPLPVDGDADRWLRSAEQDDRTIGEMARQFGLSQRALRFYESSGLLKPRREGTVRLYGVRECQRLALVLKAKSLGFTLAEIRQMLAAPQHADDGFALSISRHQCFEQIKHLEQRKREIERALSELRRTYSSFYARIAVSTD